MVTREWIWNSLLLLLFLPLTVVRSNGQYLWEVPVTPLGTDHSFNSTFTCPGFTNLEWTEIIGTNSCCWSCWWPILESSSSENWNFSFFSLKKKVYEGLSAAGQWLLQPSMVFDGLRYMGREREGRKWRVDTDCNSIKTIVKNLFSEEWQTKDLKGCKLNWF